MAKIVSHLSLSGGAEINQNNIVRVHTITSPLNDISTPAVAAYINNNITIGIDQTEIYHIRVISYEPPAPITRTYKLIDIGKGVYGLNGTALTQDNLILDSEQVFTFDSFHIPNVIDCGSVVGGEAITYVNNLADPGLTIPDQGVQDTIFKVVDSTTGITYFYWWVGLTGTYGISNPSLSTDYVQIPQDSLGFTPVTYAELVLLRDNFELKVGRQYLLTDYMTTYTQPVTLLSKTSEVIEPLLLTAIDTGKLSNIAKSILHPEDVVYYSIDADLGDGNGNEGFTKGKIYRRIDTLKNNDIGTDWRYIKYDRSGIDKLLFEDYTGCTDNIINVYTLFNTVVGNNFYGNRFIWIENTTIGNDCYNNTSEYIINNTIGTGYAYNEIQAIQNSTLGNGCFDNKIYNISSSNIGNTFSYNKGDELNMLTTGANFINLHFKGKINNKNITSITELINKLYVNTIHRQPDGTYVYSYIDNYGDTIITDIP